MTILANGNVGIGKTNPGTALDMTGQIRTTSHIEAGNGTGGVAMTVNDGYGNANLTFNHVSGVPDITGNAARIEVNTDSTTNAQMFFELGSGLTTGVAAGLTSVMRLGADGRVGIGTTSPSARVHIVSGADSNLLLSGGSKDLSVPNGEVLQIGHLDTTTNAFTERMQIAVSGNVGIGSTSPTETLVVRDVSVADDRRGIRNIAYRPHITLEDLSTSANDWQIWADSGDLSFLYGDASDGVSKLGSTAMVMDASNGNIGFGTAAPSEVLHINSINPSIRMVDTNTGADAFITANSGVGGVAIQADLNSEVVGSYIDLSVDGATRVRVTETGDVGIGDTTPDGSLKLDVNGNIGANNYCDGAGNNCIAATALGDGDNLGNHTATTNLDMNDRDIRNTRIIQGKDLDDDTGGTDNKYRMFYRDGAHTFYDGGVVIGRYGNGTWTDLANGNLIIQNQVGVGFTNPSEEVHVRRDQLSPTTVAVQNASAGADTDVSAGFTAQSNGTSLRIETYGTGATGTLGGANRADAAFMRTASGAPASSLNIGNGGAAPLNFFTTDLTRMTILANGNVGIGTTSPGANLHIDASNPTVRISGDSTGAWGGSSLYMEALGSTAANRFNQALFSMTRGSAGDASFSLQRRDDNAFTGTIMGYGDTTGLSFGTAVNNTAAATTERIKILPNGNVGISETNPAFRLDVNGSFAADYLGRRTHSSGHLVGGYNNLGANSTNTNPIFTIGTNYNPTDTTLGNMYGIGYTSGGSASFITGTGNGWGMYIASDGDARTFLSGASSNSYINKDGGNVGIGTDSPSHRLHVASSARIPEVIFAPNNNGAADKSSIVGGSGAVQIFADANIDFYESDSNTREFRFNMGNGNFEFSGNLRRITGSGNLKCPTGEVMVGFSETGIMCEEPTIIYN